MSAKLPAGQLVGKQVFILFYFLFIFLFLLLLFLLIIFYYIFFFNFYTIFVMQKNAWHVCDMLIRPALVLLVSPFACVNAVVYMYTSVYICVRLHNMSNQRLLSHTHIHMCIENYAAHVKNSCKQWHATRILIHFRCILRMPKIAVCVYGRKIIITSFNAWHMLNFFGEIYKNCTHTHKRVSNFTFSNYPLTYNFLFSHNRFCLPHSFKFFSRVQPTLKRHLPSGCALVLERRKFNLFLSPSYSFSAYSSHVNTYFGNPT